LSQRGPVAEVALPFPSSFQAGPFSAPCVLLEVAFGLCCNTCASLERLSIIERPVLQNNSWTKRGLSSPDLWLDPLVCNQLRDVLGVAVCVKCFAQTEPVKKIQAVCVAGRLCLSVGVTRAQAQEWCPEVRVHLTPPTFKM